MVSVLKEHQSEGEVKGCPRQTKPKDSTSRVAQHNQVTDGNGHSLDLIDTYLKLLIHSASFSSHSKAGSYAKTNCEWASVTKLECTVAVRD